jgi:hypothetical protein
MNHILRMTQATVGLAALACYISPGHAQDVPKDGKFSITFVATNPSPPKPVSLGDRQIVVANAMIAAVSDAEISKLKNDPNSAILHNLAGRCGSMTEYSKGAKTYQLHGYCNLSNHDGDEAFMEYSTTSPVPLGTTAVLTGRWLGGAGKFSGLSGDIDIRYWPLSGSENLVQTAGKMMGTYHIGTPAAQK